ncbi:MAG: hypothetical protein PHY80_02505 [Rickettsiales bacterium]|nr:hypothetical protein [Rickettsiales bacterium]
MEALIIKEGNALVLANAIASLEEIQTLDGKEHIRMDSALLSKLLVALNECM